MRILVLSAILSSLACVMAEHVVRGSRDVEKGRVCEFVPAPTDGPEANQWTTCETRSRIVLDRLSLKQKIADGVILGEVGLLEAAARFRDLTNGDSQAVENMRQSFPGRTDNERYARAVIAYVRCALRAGQRQTTLADKLEEQLQHHLISGAFEDQWQGTGSSGSLPNRW